MEKEITIGKNIYYFSITQVGERKFCPIILQIYRGEAFKEELSLQLMEKNETVKEAIKSAIELFKGILKVVQKKNEN